MKDIMLDLETWGTRAGCALRSIGAVQFDPRSQRLGEKFYVNVERKSCVDSGMHVDAGTEKWWSQQSQQAQDALLKDQRPIEDALAAFGNYWRKCGGEFVWSQGANFDEPIFTEACRLIGKKPPWRFYNTRCTRTAYGISGLNVFAMKREGTYHNALDDAIHQARCVQASYARLYGKMAV